MGLVRWFWFVLSSVNMLFVGMNAQEGDVTGVVISFLAYTACAYHVLKER